MLSPRAVRTLVTHPALTCRGLPTDLGEGYQKLPETFTVAEAEQLLGWTHEKAVAWTARWRRHGWLAKEGEQFRKTPEAAKTRFISNFRARAILFLVRWMAIRDLRYYAKATPYTLWQQLSGNGHETTIQDIERFLAALHKAGVLTSRGGWRLAKGMFLDEEQMREWARESEEIKGRDALIHNLNHQTECTKAEFHRRADLRHLM